MVYGLIIGAGEESVFAIEQARNLGMQVIGFDGNPNAKGLEYVDKAYVVDIRNPKEIYSVLDRNHYSDCHMIVIPVPIGRFLITSGSINDKYGLIGISEREANIFTDKYLFHKMLSRKRLRECEIRLVKRGTIPDTSKRLPIIVKPRFGSGNRQVEQISNFDEWQRFLAKAPFEEDFVLEDAIQGTEYGLDGIVINGVLSFSFLRKKEITPPPIRQCVGYYSVHRSEKPFLYQSTEEIITEIINEIGVRNCILHADIIDNMDKPFVIEMSARPSGHYLHNIFTPKVTGVNMIKQFLSYSVNGIIDLTQKDYSNSKYLIHYFDIDNRIISRVPDKEKLMNEYPLEEYVCNMTKGRTGKIVDGHSIMSRGFFILKGKNEEDTTRYARSIINEFL